MPITIASRHARRLVQARNRRLPKHQARIVNNICQLIYTEAEHIYFDAPIQTEALQTAVLFPDGSILTIHHGQIRVPRHQEKQALTQAFQHHPEHLQHSPRQLNNAAPYQNFTAICLQILTPHTPASG